VLIKGVLEYLMDVPNGTPEFRYLMHEVTEETHHIQMFQEFVNRTGSDIPGGARWFRVVQSVLPVFGRLLPEIFFTGILAGEEPIDHLQKSIMRAGGSHPLIDRVMQIHIAEEARHIGFAHQYLEHHWSEMGPVKRRMLTYLFPVIMRRLCDVIMVPSKPDQRAMGIPPEVAKEIWWDSPESRKLLRDLFADVRMLADNLGIRKGGARLVWKALGIDGERSRFRSAPSSARS
jgi:hypothetical protein